MTSPLAFSLEDVSKRFGDRWALRRLTLALPLGRSLLVTGHNGSGKTTLLRLLSSLDSPTLGRVEVLGLNPAREPEGIRGQVALLSHQSALYEDLTAEQNLLFLCRMLQLPSPKKVCDDALDRVGLSTRSDRPVRQFSAGMRKRLMIGRLLVKRPRLALLDEPFGELDAKGSELVEQLIGELSRAGASIVLSTHQVEQGLSLCDVRLHLEGGAAARA